MQPYIFRYQLFLRKMVLGIKERSTTKKLHFQLENALIIKTEDCQCWNHRICLPNYGFRWKSKVNSEFGFGVENTSWSKWHWSKEPLGRSTVKIGDARWWQMYVCCVPRRGMQLICFKAVQTDRAVLGTEMNRCWQDATKLLFVALVCAMF